MQAQKHSRRQLYDDPRSDRLLPRPGGPGPTLEPSYLYKSSFILSSHPAHNTMTSSHSQILNSFDPHAVHPFTNGSGLAPQPPRPSQFPIPIPPPRRPSAFSPTYSQYPDEYKQSPPSSSPNSSVSSNSPSSPVYAPQPQRRPTSASPPRSQTAPSQPLFVPFRQETSSPDLVLKKKTLTTKSAGTQTSATSRKS